MRKTLLVITAATATVLLVPDAVGARHSDKKEKKTTVQQAPGTGTAGHHSRAQARCLHRARNGQLFVWSGGRWMPAGETPQHAGQAVPSVRTGDYSSTAAGSAHPAPANRDVVNGLDWHLNGRGYATE